MIKSKMLTVLTFALAAGALSACSSFAPVYGDPAGGRDMGSVAFNFAPPDSRLEQIIINRLKVAFPAQASPGDPVLDVVANVRSTPGSMSDAFSVARPETVRIEAAVTISQGDEPLFRAVRVADTTYQGGKLTPTNMTSSAGAQERAALSVSDALRAAVLAGYSP